MNFEPLKQLVAAARAASSEASSELAAWTGLVAAEVVMTRALVVESLLSPEEKVQALKVRMLAKHALEAACTAQTALKNAERTMWSVREAVESLLMKTEEDQKP